MVFKKRTRVDLAKKTLLEHISPIERRERVPIKDAGGRVIVEKGGTINNILHMPIGVGFGVSSAQIRNMRAHKSGLPSMWKISRVATEIFTLPVYHPAFSRCTFLSPLGIKYL
jgi:hypothetical protein